MSNVEQLRAHAEIPPRDDRDWVTSAELVTETGCTYRQIDYWARTGLLTSLDEATPGSGFVRRYHQDQVTRAAVIRDLFGAGLSGEVVRHIVDQVLEHGHATVGPIVIHRPDTSGDAA